MKTAFTISLWFVVFTFCSDACAQQGETYIDSVKKQVLYTDSIITAHAIDSASAAGIINKSLHFSKPGKELCGRAELYADSTGAGLRLSYANTCDSTPLLQDFYFFKNKIVFIRTVNITKPGLYTDQYYFDDKLVTGGAEKPYIGDGYELFKNVSK